MATEPEHEGRYRVYAVESARDGIVKAYGGGWFIGNLRPPNGTPSCFGPIGDDLGPEYTNPCIQLDDDRGIVWGCQCWWGPEEKTRERFAGLTEVIVAPPAVNDSPVVE
jgi:hypothetical protein